MPGTARRHVCAICRKAKQDDEFPAGTARLAAKGEWVCTACQTTTVPAATAAVAAAAPAAARPLLRSAAAPQSTAPPRSTATPGSVVRQWVNNANEFVKANIPNTPWPNAPNGPKLPPVTIPYVDRLLRYASELDSGDNVTHRLMMIQSSMGRAASYGIGVPDPTKPLTFPTDHHFHPTYPQEWYYVCAKLPIKDAQGNVGEVAFLASIIRQRSVGLAEQAAAGWSDYEVTTMNNVASATIRLYDPKDSTKCARSIFARASPNAYWGVLDPGQMRFSKPGEVFQVGCGTANLVSTQPATSTEILPLKLDLDNRAPDGSSNIKVSFTLAAAPGVSSSQGWFLQGVPIPDPQDPTAINGRPGCGYSIGSTPGIYYSWPQVAIKNASVSVNGETFTVLGDGNGWIDHEAIMASLFNYDAATNTSPVEPIPFLEDASPMQGWTWQFCNHKDGKTAWTGSTFVFGNAALSTLSPSPSGYYVTRGANGVYSGAFASGATIQSPDMTVTSPSGMPTDTPLAFVSVYKVANNRSFEEAHGTWLPFVAKAAGWNDANGNPIPAIFNTNDFGVICECPAIFTCPLTNWPIGWGYLESQGFEGNLPLLNRQLHYLETKTYPVSPLVETVTRK